jgi:hypothetical protein
MKEGMNAPHESINANVVQQKDWRKGGPAVIPSSLSPANENPSPGHASRRRKKSILGHS